MDSFVVLDENNACEVDDPKLEAYKQMAYLRAIGIGYVLCIGEDGSYTVQGDNSAPITFKQRGN